MIQQKYLNLALISVGVLIPTYFLFKKFNNKITNKVGKINKNLLKK